jgi:nucleotide-binding universal stress UspA family protein
MRADGNNSVGARCLLLTSGAKARIHLSSCHDSVMASLFVTSRMVCEVMKMDVYQYGVAVERKSHMKQSIIVPLDGSDICEGAIGIAQRMAGSATSLTLIRVVPRPELTCPDSHVQHSGPSIQVPTYNAVRTVADCQCARAYLDDLILRYGLPLGTESLVAVGDPVARILDIVRRLENPIVVMTTIDNQTRGTNRLGTVPRRLLASGQVPVIGIPAAFPVVAQIGPRMAQSATGNLHDQNSTPT